MCLTSHQVVSPNGLAPEGLRTRQIPDKHKKGHRQIIKTANFQLLPHLPDRRGPSRFLFCSQGSGYTNRSRLAKYTQGKF